jgi:aminoglycoside 3'-phosphotransferase I
LIEVREIACEPIEVAENLSSLLYGYHWSRDTVGESGCAVYRLYGKKSAQDLYLKYGHGDYAADVTDEAARLRWLVGRVPAPEVIGSADENDNAWLVMTAVAGQTAYQIVDALASFLRTFHQVPIADCPFDSGLELRLALARQRLEVGLVDSDDFDEERIGLSQQQVWDRMVALLPIANDLVVTHGDFSLDNPIFDREKLSGCVDVGRVGVADRYQDIAILWNSLGEFGGALQQRFLESYGITELDCNKLQLHLMLDEFF